MASKPITRDYKFSDATLKQKADDLIDSVTRDITDFTDRGVTDTSVISGLRTTFDSLQSDSYYRGLVSIKTQERDTVFDDLKKAVGTVRIMAANQWKNTSDARYTIYDFDQLTNINPKDLVELAKNVHAVATDQLAQLTNHGMTPARLDELQALKVDLDVKIDLKRKAEKARDIATQERILAGNALYQEMIRLTNIGKDLYQYDDEAKYNDYVIYNTPTADAPEPTPEVPEGTALVGGLLTDIADNEAINGGTVVNETTGTIMTTIATGQFADTNPAVGDNTYTASAPGYESVSTVFNVLENSFNELLMQLTASVE